MTEVEIYTGFVTDLVSLQMIHLLYIFEDHERVSEDGEDLEHHSRLVVDLPGVEKVSS